MAPGHVGQGQQYRLAPTALALALSRLHNLMSRAEILKGWFNGKRRAINACNSAKPVLLPEQGTLKNQHCLAKCQARSL